MYFTVRFILSTLSVLLNLRVSLLQDSFTTIVYANLRENYDNLENLANLNYDTFNITHSGNSKDDEKDVSNILHKLPVRLRFKDIVTNISDAKTLGLTENLICTKGMNLHSGDIMVLIIKCVTWNVLVQGQGLLSSSDSENEITLFYDVGTNNSVEYASYLVVSKEKPTEKVHQISAEEEEEELKSCEAKSVGLFKNVETEFDISPLRIKIDKYDNAIFTVHVKTGPSNKLIGFGTKRVYVQVQSTNKDNDIEKALKSFMARILLVNPNNIKFKRGPGQHLKRIIVPINSIKANLSLKKLIDTFKLSKCQARVLLHPSSNIPVQLCLFAVYSLSKFTPKGSDYFTSKWTTSELRGVSSEDSEYLRKWKENKHKEVMNKDDKTMVFIRRMKNRKNRNGIHRQLNADLLRERLMNLKLKGV